MGDEIHYKEWRIDLMHGTSGWEALIYRPGSPLHEMSVPVGQARRTVLEEGKRQIDDLLAK
jgi:hypothetical protein